MMVLILATAAMAWPNVPAAVEPPKPVPATPVGDPGNPGLIWFTADWCQPCKTMAPIIERMQAAGYRIAVVKDTDRSNLGKTFAELWRVRVYPTFIGVRDRLAVRRIEGVTDQDGLLSLYFETLSVRRGVFGRATVTVPVQATIQPACVGGT